MRRYNIPQSKSRKVQTKSRNKQSKSSSKADDAYIPGPDSSESLRKAVFLNSPEEVISLLHKGADPNHQLEGGISPLHCLFFSSTPTTHDYSYLCSRSGGKVRKAILIIGHLVRSGARLLPDSSGLTPISLALLTRSHSLAKQLVLTADCSVNDIIHYNYFSMPKATGINHIDLLKHSSRVQKALLFHVKHGVAPYHNPLDTNLRLLTTVYTSQLTDWMDVYTYQFSSYLAVHPRRGKVMLRVVHVLISEVSGRIIRSASTNTDITKFVSLFRTLITWLNSHESISDDDAISCWQYMVEVLESEQVRTKLDCIVPGMIFFLYKFILPVLELCTVVSYACDNRFISTTFLIIILMKVVSVSEHYDLFPKKEQESVFDLLNRKHLMILAIHESMSKYYSKMKWLFSDIFEVLDFALPHMFYLKEQFLGRGTVLHAAAEFGNGELVRYFLKAGVSPFIKDSSGRTFVHILRNRGFYDLCKDICSEFDIQRPFRLAVLAASAYVRYRLPLARLHGYPLLRKFVVKLCSREECKQMCAHCFKEFSS